MTFQSAAELASNPAMMEPPAVLVPPMAVEGRVVMAVSGPKGGKSTTAAGVLSEGSRNGIKGGLLTLDEAMPDSLQRLERFNADLNLVYLTDDFDPVTIAEEVATLGLDIMVVDHVGKLAERHPDFGPGSQGDPLLWGRLMSPFTDLARDLNLAIILLDQARKSDGLYAGSTAKAGSVDILCEMHSKDGGLICTPKGRVYLPAFRIDLDAHGLPVFSGQTDDLPITAKGRGDKVSDRHRLEVLAALQSAEPEGLKSTQWLALAKERTGLGRSTLMNIKRTLHREGLVSYTSTIYRVSPSGDKRLQEMEAA
jgi:hypothetical protein